MNNNSTDETTAHILRVRELLYIVQNKYENGPHNQDSAQLQVLFEIQAAVKTLPVSDQHYVDMHATNLRRMMAPSGICEAVANNDSSLCSQSADEIQTGRHAFDNGCPAMADAKINGQPRPRPSRTRRDGFENGSKNVRHPASIGQSGSGKSFEWGGEAQNGERQTNQFVSISVSDQWTVEPNVGRVANGIPFRMDRLKGLGNAVVPQIPYLIGQAINLIEA